MRYQAYEEVEPLGTRALFELLTGGDAQERVWASWALGLRLDTKLVPVLKRLVQSERVPGARRHQAMMLAGFGAKEAVLDLAARDPDARVRATALGFLARCTDRDDVSTFDLLAHRLLNDDPIVREAIAENLDRDDAPAFVRDALKALVPREEVSAPPTFRPTVYPLSPTLI